MTDILIVQHAEKSTGPGDPTLTPLGREQARSTAAHLAGLGIAAVWSSPAIRAQQTAAPIAQALGLAVRLDDRLRERMSWDDPARQSQEAFLAEWARTNEDRTFVPTWGDSSQAAGDRLLAALNAIRQDGATVVTVSHGGVTVDLLRTLFGDAWVNRSNPRLIPTGVPNGALTRLRWRQGRWEPVVVASTAHLETRPPGSGPTGPRSRRGGQ